MSYDHFKKVVEFNLPVYVNTTPVLRLSSVDFNISDILKSAVIARMNIGLLGDTGNGKTQLEKDIMSMFGGRANYVLGRNDLDIKQLYRHIDFTELIKAKNRGGKVSASDITHVTERAHMPLTVVDEINRCVEAVQNQLFNIFDGYIEIDGKSYPLGQGQIQTQNISGKESSRNSVYSIGICSANYGNGKFTGTSTMDRAMKDRLHLTVDVDNFSPGNEDLDGIICKSSGEVRTKDSSSESITSDIIGANDYFKEKSGELGPEELLYFRYLVNGLDYIPIEAADNSKRKIKEVWPGKAEEDNLGSDDEIYLYRMVSPASVRGALATLNLARVLREYAKVKDPNFDKGYTSRGSVILDSVISAFQLTGAYSGIIANQQRLNEDFVGNPHNAMKKVSEIVKKRLYDGYDMIKAIIISKVNKTPFTKKMENFCKGDFACFK